MNSERISSEIDSEVQTILTGADERAKVALATNRTLLDRVAQTLMEVESLEGDALDQLLLEVESVPAQPLRAAAGS